MRRLLRLLGVLVTVAAVGAAALLAVVLPAARAVDRGGGQLHGVPPLAKALRRPPTRSVVYAADGSVLAYLYRDQDREVVPLARIPKVARNAVLAIEDARFYQHGALDYRGVARALLTDLRGGAIREGGSTLTQQYVKNTVTGDAVSLRRKLVEAVDASRLERRLSKDQILADYLNEVYFGDGVYGIATAAEHYFSKPVGRLSLPEAAAIAGTIAAPDRYKPTGGRVARARRDQVLARMAAVRFITPAAAAAAERQPLRPHLQRPTVRFPFFVDEVVRTLLDDPSLDAALGPARSAARERAVYEGGLQVRTTLEPRDQQLAEAAVQAQLPPGPQGAVASVDPRSGAILALVGGRDYGASQVDLATGRGGAGGFPPGSSFKVFYLVAALEQGVSPATRFDARSPVTVTAPECPSGYTVHNAEPGGSGPIDLWRATAGSVNAYYAQLMVRVGTPAAIEVARRMGVTAPLHDWCSLVLGTENVTPLQLASAYATLASGGVHCDPTPVAAVVGPDGRTLDAGAPRCRRVLDPRIAGTAVDILRGVVAPGGTGFRAAIGRPLAGKTGTTSDNRDAWFTGFTPDLATSVWVGFPSAQIPMDQLFNGGPVFGGTFPALIFQQYMAAALAGRPPLPLPTAGAGAPARR